MEVVEHLNPRLGCNYYIFNDPFLCIMLFFREDALCRGFKRKSAITSFNLSPFQFCHSWYSEYGWR